MSKRVSVRVQHSGGKKSESTIGTTWCVFIKDPDNTIVTAISLDIERHTRSTPRCGDSIELDVILERAKETVAKPPILTGQLHRTDQVRWLNKLPFCDLDPGCEHRLNRFTPDSPGIDQGRGSATTADSPAPCIRPRGSNKDFLSFQEKQSLFRKKSFGRGQVDHHIIRLNDAEIRIYRGGHLKIGRGSPEEISTNPILYFFINLIIGHRRKRKNAELLFWINTFDLKGLQRRNKLGNRRWQGRPTPAFIQVGHPSGHIETNAPYISCLRHGYSRPWNPEFCGPAGFRLFRLAPPGAIPIT